MRRIPVMLATLMVASVLAVVADPTSRIASACSCSESTAAERRAAADYGIVGLLVDRIDQVAESRRIDPSDPSSPVVPGIPTGSSTLVFDVVRVLKGTAEVTVAIETAPDGGLCGSSIRTPGFYVVYGTISSTSGQLGVGSCDEVQSLGTTLLGFTGGREPLPDTVAACASRDDPPGSLCARRSLSTPAASGTDTIALFCTSDDGERCTMWRESANLDGWCWTVPDIRNPRMLAADRNCDGGADPNPPALAAQTLTPVAPAVGASAVFANISMVDPLAPGYITASRCSGLARGPQQTASGNHTIGVPVSNVAIVPLDPDGRFCVFNLRPIDLVVDIQGVFAPPAAGGLRFTAVSPRRLVDTRDGLLNQSESIVRVRTGAPPGAKAALVNLSMINGIRDSFVSTCPGGSAPSGGSAPARPLTALGTFPRRAAISNLAIVNLDQNGDFCLVTRAVDVIVDLQGTFQSGTGARYTPSAPARVLDTRGAPRATAGSIIRVPAGAAAGTTSVVVNLAIADAMTDGYVTAGPCSTLRAGPQSVATSTHVPGKVRSNLAVVPVDADGSFCVFMQQSVDLVVDVVGSFSPSGPDEFFPVDAFRALDTRR